MRLRIAYLALVAIVGLVLVVTLFRREVDLSAPPPPAPVTPAEDVPAAPPPPILRNPLALVTGRVVDENGDPVAGARVELNRLDLSILDRIPLEECRTGGDGAFALPQLHPLGESSRLEVRASAPGRATIRTIRDVAPTGLVLVLPPTRRIVVSVHRRDDGCASPAPRPPSGDRRKAPR